MIVDPKARWADTSIVELAEDWQCSTARARLQRADERRWLAVPNDPALPPNWRSWGHKVETEAELNSLRRGVKRDLPFGDGNWIRSSAGRLGLETTTRLRGRPKKETCPIFSSKSKAFTPNSLKDFADGLATP